MNERPIPTRKIGYHVDSTIFGETARCFVPYPLPPDPVLDTAFFFDQHSRAADLLGELRGLTLILPDPQMFIQSYQRKEALVSSQIEGTQSSLSDLLLEFEGNTEENINDYQETTNYVKSLNHAQKRMREDGLPISSRLLRECHEILLSSGRGADKNPGEFRRSQNWIGGSRPGNAHFVPPPPENVAETMGQLENFLNSHRPQSFYDQKQTTHGIIHSSLLRAALSHVQFETIHPFLDGNGRIGRILILLILIEAGNIDQPILYLSLWFKKHRDDYYNLLTHVRETGRWEAWIEFFLDGVIHTASEARDTAKKILKLFADDKKRIESESINSATLLSIYEYICRKTFVSATKTAHDIELSFPTVNNYFQTLENLGIISEFTGRSRGRVFVYTEYFALLKPGTDPLPR